LVSELQEQLSQPPKPKLIVQKRLHVDVAALRQKIIELETDKTQYADELQRQRDVIKSLRRDVTSANARLSDVTGELHSSYFPFFFY